MWNSENFRGNVVEFSGRDTASLAGPKSCKEVLFDVGRIPSESKTIL